MQLDRPERGFSYAADAPLDMRMDPTQETTAAELVNTWAERELVTIFRRYGEERYAKQIGRAIVRRRREQPFERTGELVDVIKAAIPAPARFGDGHPAKRVFQALRIAVNDELGSLEAALPAALEMLRPGGRLAVISFHSLEDRIVKHFLRERERGCTCPPDFPVCVCGHEPELRAVAAAAGPAERGRDREQPALVVGPAARRGQGRGRRVSAVDWFASGRRRRAGFRTAPAAPGASRRRTRPQGTAAPRAAPGARSASPAASPGWRPSRCCWPVWSLSMSPCFARTWPSTGSTPSRRSSRPRTRRSRRSSRPRRRRRGSRRPRTGSGSSRLRPQDTSYLDLARP